METWIRCAVQPLRSEKVFKQATPAGQECSPCGIINPRWLRPAAQPGARRDQPFGRLDCPPPSSAASPLPRRSLLQDGADPGSTLQRLGRLSSRPPMRVCGRRSRTGPPPNSLIGPWRPDAGRASDLGPKVTGTHTDFWRRANHHSAESVCSRFLSLLQSTSLKQFSARSGAALKPRFGLGFGSGA